MGDAEHVISQVTEALLPFEHSTREPLTLGLSKGEYCRWLLPASGYRARKVLASWRPYGLSSSLKWLVARILAGVPGAAGRVPGLRRLPPLPQVDGSALGLSGVDGALSPVVYVGTPGPQRKAVCSLVDRDGRAVAILKLPLQPGAEPSLTREAENLMRLQENFPALAVPRALPKPSQTIFLQTILPGKPSGRDFTQAHADFLLSLRSDKQVNLAPAAASHHLPPERLTGAVMSWRDGLVGSVPAVWVHGDFAPWNLLSRADGGLAAFDWEEGRPDGLPVWDIAHFHAQQAFLFGEVGSTLVRMEANSAYRAYLHSLGLTEKTGRDLFRLYCLASAGEALSAGQEERAQFFLRHLSSEIDSQ